MSQTTNSTHCCDEMKRHLGDGEAGISYSERFREYGIKILDGGSAILMIGYCPWCGAKLPVSLRDEWFDLLEKLGLEPGDPQVPEEMSSGLWWRQRGL